MVSSVPPFVSATGISMAALGNANCSKGASKNNTSTSRQPRPPEATALHHLTMIHSLVPPIHRRPVATASLPYSHFPLDHKRQANYQHNPGDVPRKPVRTFIHLINLSYLSHGTSPASHPISCAPTVPTCKHNGSWALPNYSPVRHW